MARLTMMSVLLAGTEAAAPGVLVERLSWARAILQESDTLRRAPSLTP